MLPEETIHLVNGRQLSDQQYADYKEAIGYERGYKAGQREVVGWLKKKRVATDLLGAARWYASVDEYQAQLKKWGID